MGIVYHGSHIHSIKKLEPRKSTHGTYVYATGSREMAILFSNRCGDNLTYSLGRTNKDDPFYLVERIPNSFNYMFSGDSSIYTLDDKNFKSIGSSFGSNEVVSEVPVKVLKEEYIPSLMDEIDKLEESGFIKIYRYPHKPDNIPANDIDLFEHILNRLKRQNAEISKGDFFRLVYLHPNLLDHVNEFLYGMDKDIITDEELIEIFNRYKNRTDIENYVNSAYELLDKYYPEIAENIDVQDKVIR